MACLATEGVYEMGIESLPMEPQEASPWALAGMQLPVQERVPLWEQVQQEP